MEKKLFICRPIKFSFKKDHFERLAREHERLVCGIDEVGRGSLAGPVVASAVIIKPSAGRKALIDSKLLRPEEREESYHWIRKNSWHATALMSPLVIDQVNIYQATIRAMTRALHQLIISSGKTPSIILTDAVPLNLEALTAPEAPNLPEAALLEDVLVNPWGKVLYFPFGEKRSRSIAAASIVAKVTRDRLMQRLGNDFPAYSLGKHKGYGTPLHQQTIETNGPSIIHRMNYLPEETGLESWNLAIPFDQPYEQLDQMAESAIEQEMI